MNTDGHGLGTANRALITANGEDRRFAARELKRRRRRAASQKPDGEPFSDPITKALARNREAASYVRFPEGECWVDHVFQCVCCRRMRPNRQRRERDSEVCVMCERAAGFN
jgi:hypothetical protein